MISHLRGALLEKNPNAVVVDVQGVGYEVTIPVSVYSSLPVIGSEVALHIHMHVRRTRSRLFGFVTAGDKALFEKLISVSGHRAQAGGNGFERARVGGPDGGDPQRRGGSTGEDSRRR